jgi:hypothetical protein
MEDHAGRLKNDLEIIYAVLGLNTWTGKDIRRGFLGNVAGGMAGMILAAWSLSSDNVLPPLLVFAGILGGILILKDMGFRRNAAPSPGTQREVAFYGRFFGVGTLMIGAFYLWAQHLGFEPAAALGLGVAISGFWYLLYAISSSNRAISLYGAIPLIVCGFVLPELNNPSLMFGAIGFATCVGCWLEALALFLAVRQAMKSAHAH